MINIVSASPLLPAPNGGGGGTVLQGLIFTGVLIVIGVFILVMLRRRR